MNKIVIIQLYSNGDILYGTPLAKQLKHDYPYCHITWIVADFCKAILNNNPYIDTIVSYPIKKNDITELRKIKTKYHLEKNKGIWDEVFFIHNQDNNQAYYDGTIRTNIINSFHYKITQGMQPILVLTENELLKVKEWSENKNLKKYKHVILFEFAPLSGQSSLTNEMALHIAEILCMNNNICVIMSSANKIKTNSNSIIDGSELSLRETVALTHYCTLLLGTSSGITWASTSTAGNLLPMVQLLNPNSKWANPISRDFIRQGKSVSELIEITDIQTDKIVSCIKMIIDVNFETAKKTFNQEVPLHFKTTRSIIYNLLCYFQWSSIFKHIQYNVKQYGFNISFFYNVIVGFILSPFTLIKNKLLKSFK